MTKSADVASLIISCCISGDYMIRLWNRIKLKNKIVLTGISFIFLFAFITMVYFIPSIKTESMEKKKNELRDIVDISISLMDALKFESENGRMTIDEAENKAVYYTGKFRYGDDLANTVWIINSEGVIYSMPYREDLVGKNISSLVHEGKRNVYKEMLDLCKKNSDGFIEYSAQYKSEVTKIVPVISFVRYYEPYNLIVGSTIYIDDVKAEILTLYIKVICATLIITVTALVMLILVARKIARPIQDIVEGISKSDLNTELHTVLEDEIGLLVNHFNSFVKNIRGVIIEINETSESLSSSAEQLSGISISFTRKTEEQNSFSMEVISKVRSITGDVENVAMQIDNEFDKMNNLIQIMNTLSEIIHSIDEKTVNAVKTIKYISTNAENGEISLKKMLGSISKLEDRSADMNNIVTMINDISDRINLLSLNAAIEAARAGDAGRGFAVVADEISKLADATSSSINEISRIIKDNDCELKEGLVHIQSTVKVISLMMEGFNNTRQWIEELAVQIKQQLGTKESVQQEAHEIRNMSDAIRKTTREQKTSVMEINALMEKINLSTEVISSGSMELAEGAREVTSMSENLSSKVALFKV